MDTMGEVVYSINFGCISMGSIPASLHTFKATPKIIGRFTPVPWLFLVFASIPGMGREWLQFKKSCSDRLDARFREKEQKSDVSCICLLSGCSILLISTRSSSIFSNPMIRTRTLTLSSLILSQFLQPAGISSQFFVLD